MHMADALVSPAVGGTMIALSSAVAAYSIHKVKEENDPKKIPVMGVMGAFVFASQMINFTIPGTGSSGHLCGGMLLTALLGPYAGFLTMIGVLFIQCLLFADGGILALGCNIWNMAFYGCFIGCIIWKFFMKDGMNKKKIIFASIIGCVLTLQLGAFSVTIETLLSHITALPFKTFTLFMQPIHLLIGSMEGLITSAILIFIYEVRPELLYLYNQDNTNRFSFKKTLVVLMVITCFIGGGLSLFASSNPDGLEWSIEKVTGSTEVESNSSLHKNAADIQKSTAILPDYTVPGLNDSLGTSFSGIIGGIVVISICTLLALVIKKIGKKIQNDTN